MHFLFRHQPGTPHAICWILDKYGEVDVRNKDDGYLVLPGSLHPNGKRYKWLPSSADLSALPVMPHWLHQEILRGHGKTSGKGCQEVSKKTTAPPKDSVTTSKDNPLPYQNVFPSLDPKARIPARYRKGVFSEFFRLVLPKNRWEKFSKHPTFKDLIDDGLPILPGTRFHAERRVGSLIARCYANPSVAVRLLDLFRYCYFPQRRTRKEEEAINAWVRSLATQNYKKQNRAYDSSAPDYADPLAWRYWHNLQHRKNSFPRLIYSICTRRMAPYGLTIQDLLFILYSLFRSGLVYVLCVSFCMRHAISITEYSGKGWKALRGKLQEVVWEKVCAPWEENFLVYEDEIVEEEPISDPPAPSATPLSTYDLQNDPSEYDALWEFNQKQLAKKAVGYTPTPEEVSAAMTAFKGTPAGSRLTPGALRTAVFAKLRAAFWLRERKKTQSKRKNHGYQSRPTRRIRGSATEAEIRQQEMEEAARLKRRRGGGSKKEITRSLG
jgi:hypothetical protein